MGSDNHRRTGGHTRRTMLVGSAAGAASVAGCSTVSDVSSGDRPAAAGNDANTAQRSSTGSNGVRYAAPGELQDVLSGASRGDVVQLVSGERYDPGSETVVPSGVTLDFNGAKWEPSEPYDGFFVLPKASLLDSKRRGAELDVTGVDFTDHHCVSLDVGRTRETTEMSGYLGQDIETKVAVGCINDDNTGVGLHMDAHEGAIGIGVQVYCKAVRFNIGEDWHAQGGWIQGQDHIVSLNKNTTDIFYHAHADGDDPDEGFQDDESAFRNRMNGIIQTGEVSEYGIRSETDEGASIVDGPVFFGYFADGHQYSKAAIDAEAVYVHTHKTTQSIIAGHTTIGDNASGILTGYYPSTQRIETMALDTQEAVERRYGNAAPLHYHVDGSFVFGIRDFQVVCKQQLKVDDAKGLGIHIKDAEGGDHHVRPDSKGTVLRNATGGHTYTGLRSAPPHSAEGSGDIYVDDGSNTESGNPGWRIDDPDGGSWVDMN